MAVAVDPFSFATAELSDEYVNVFPDPDIVPKYLEKVSDKTGVQLLAGDNNCLSVKGSWVSLKRVRSFLTEFLISYQNVNQDEDKKQTDLLDRVQSISDHEPDSEDSGEFEEPLQVPKKESQFHHNADEQSEWLKWTAEILPQIQRRRSKRASQPSAHVEPKSQVGKVPEPLVVIASYQPAPEPAAKKIPTLAAIERVLKTVYDKDKAKSVSSNTAGSVHASQSADHAASSGPRSPKHEVELTVVKEECSAPLLDQPAATGVTDQACTPSDTRIDHSSLSDTNEVECIAEVAESSVSNTSVSLLQNTDSVSETIVPTQHDLSGRPESTSRVGTLTNEQNRRSGKRFGGRKRKPQESGKHSSASGSVVGTRSIATSEADKDGVPSTITTNTVPSPEVSSQGMAAARKARRKGYPRRGAQHREKTPEGESDTTIVSRPPRAKRVAKRGTVKAKLSKPETKRRAREKDSDTDYDCDLCSYVAKKRSHLREHRRRVHITKEFTCDKCGKVFGFRKDLKRHYSTHERAEHCCDTCGKMYKTVRTLAEHKKIHQTNYIKPEYPCEFCQKSFSTKYVLAYHIKAEHLGIKKSYMCPTCGKSFSQKNSYLQHANVHMGIKPYQCDVCGRSFSYEKSLKEHKYMHEENKQFECDVCHKKFRQSSGVAIHMKIHKERKDYVCSACGKGFSQKQALIRHERIHIGEKPFACALCKRTFTDSSILRRHMMLIHKKDKTNWRQHTENNVQRRTDFYISVVGEDGKLQKAKTPLIGARASFDSIRLLDVPSVSGRSCSLQSVEESPNFMTSVGGVSAFPAPPLSSVPSSAIATVAAMSVSQDYRVTQQATDGGLPALPIHNLHTALRKKEVAQTETGFAVPVCDSHSVTKEPSRSAQAVDLSFAHQSDAHLHAAQTSAILTSLAFSDHLPHPHAQLYASSVQQHSRRLVGMSSQQYQTTDSLPHADGDFHPAMMMLSDSVSTPHHLHTGHVTGASVSTVPPGQGADYDSLVSRPVVQEQYAHTQQR